MLSPCPPSKARIGGSNEDGEHPSVADAAVIGLPNADLGEEVGAAVVLKPGESTTSPAMTTSSSRLRTRRKEGKRPGQPSLRRPASTTARPNGLASSARRSQPASPSAA
ncbi:AMP-binding enzyme [Streptomyces albiflavescens]|uniref:AMP-binding enzyme n=1 Tax=Streptomyces albiflavescens TaxID=1623582 RepID=UPI0027E43C6E|nr:hypothetical protein [Streptomyces albiflavescens]